MKSKNVPIPVTVRNIAYAKAIRCIGVQPVVEITIGLKELLRLVDSVIPALQSIGFDDAGIAAKAFVQSIPSYSGKPEKIEITTMANAAMMLPELKSDLNDYINKTEIVLNKERKT